MGLPKAINSDNEFDKGMLNDYFDENNIACYYSQPNEINKNSIVERFNRTMWTNKNIDWLLVNTTGMHG